MHQDQQAGYMEELGARYCHWLSDMSRDMRAACHQSQEKEAVSFAVVPTAHLAAIDLNYRLALQTDSPTRETAIEDDHSVAPTAHTQHAGVSTNTPSQFVGDSINTSAQFLGNSINTSA